MAKMNRYKICIGLILTVCIIVFPSLSSAWFDTTHIAIAKVAGYHKWYNAAAADIAKVKAGKVETKNHYVNNPPGTVITPEIIIAQAEEYNQIGGKGHLYGAIIQSLRDYIKAKDTGKYGEYHMAYCSHYVGDLSMPLHNTLYSAFNRKHHITIDGIIDREVLNNLDKIKIYPVTINSEEEFAKEIARIANLSMKLGYKIEAEDRLLTKEEAYRQISHSAALFKAILDYVARR